MKKYNTGVIIGRFQVDELHDGHQELIDTVINECDRVIIFIGTTVVRDSDKNPMDYRTREYMIRQTYGSVDGVTIAPLADTPSNEDWSKALDTKIREIDQVGSVMLYGGRDSFIPCYSGDFQTTQIEIVPDVSATHLRKEIANSLITTAEGRRGIIHGLAKPWPKVHPTVDAAVVRWDLTLENTKDMKPTQVILGQKPGETKWRFPGGFADPTDDSFEDAAIREAHEELGNIEVTNARIIGSRRINDWRYRSEKNKVITTFVLMDYVFGSVKAGDDLAEAKFVKFDDIISGKIEIMPAHQSLMDMLLMHLGLDESNQTTVGN